MSGLVELYKTVTIGIFLPNSLSLGGFHGVKEPGQVRPTARVYLKPFIKVWRSEKHVPTLAS